MNFGKGAHSASPQLLPGVQGHWLEHLTIDPPRRPITYHMKFNSFEFLRERHEIFKQRQHRSQVRVGVGVGVGLGAGLGSPTSRARDE